MHLLKPEFVVARIAAVPLPCGFLIVMSMSTRPRRVLSLMLCSYRFCGYSGRLDGKLELLALEDLGVVDVEKVAVQDRLDEAGDNGNVVDLVVGLAEVPVDPVGDVESAVAAERKEVVGGDGLSLSGSLQHEELGENGHGLEPDGEGPEYLGEGVVIGECDGKDGGTGEEVLDAEGIDVGVVGGLVGVGHEIDDVSLRTEEEELKDKVVDAIGREDVCEVLETWRTRYRESYQDNE